MWQMRQMMRHCQARHCQQAVCFALLHDGCDELRTEKGSLPSNLFIQRHAEQTDKIIFIVPLIQLELNNFLTDPYSTLPWKLRNGTQRNRPPEKCLLQHFHVQTHR